MPTKSQSIACLLLIALWLLSQSGIITAQAMQSGEPVVQAEAYQPPCHLLDDPDVRMRMSGMFEEALLQACGQETSGPTSLPGEPVWAQINLSGPDVRVNGIDPIASSTTQSETSIAINPNTGTICSHYNDSYHYHIQGTGYIGFSRSIDGGNTFEDGGVLPQGGNGRSRGDPSVVWRAADGLFYATSIHENTQNGNYGLGFWQSSDDCATFNWMGMAHSGTSDDKELLAVDNNPASPYFGRLYMAWTDFGAGGYIRLIRSDNGTSWSTPVNLSSSTWVQGAWPAVAPNGDVYVAWLHWTGSGETMSFEIVRSTNGGLSFTQVTNPQSNVTVPYDDNASAYCGRDALKGYIRYLPSPQITVGPDGCLHAAYSYDPDGHGTGDVVDSFYRRSCDNGTTWGPEVLLNDDTTLADQFFPAVAVNPNNVVAASWYDRRLDPDGNLLFDRYKVLSRDGGLTWEANERVSDVSSPVYINPQSSSCYHGDYDQLAADSNWLYVQWSDDRVFFNGHYDPDVWFEKQEIMAPEPDFTLAVTPDTRQVIAPAVVTATISVEPLNGFTQTVTLSEAGLPAGVSTAFEPNPVAVPGTAVYTIAIEAGAPAGEFTWPITATGGGEAHAVDFTLVIVPPPPDFSLSITPTNFQALPGTAVTATVDLAPLNGFTQTVLLADTGLPPEVSTAFSANPVPVPGTATYTITVGEGALPGEYAWPVIASGGGVEHTMVISLTVEPPPPDFSLVVMPAAQSLCTPGAITATVNLEPLHGFSETVTLMDSAIPAGISTVFSPNPVPVPGTAAYTVTVEAGMPAGEYAWPVTATGGGQQHDQVFSLTVNGEIPASPILLIPQDGVMEVPTATITFAWESVPGAEEYLFQLDEDPAFGSPEADLTGIITNSLVLTAPLNYSTEYYWRVKASNACDGVFSEPFRFTTQAPCTAPGLPAIHWEPVTPTAGQSIIFTVEVTGSEPIDFAWDWGDGITGTGSTTAHTYATSGSYAITLVVTNPCGSQNISESIEVIAPMYRTFLPYVLRNSP